MPGPDGYKGPRGEAGEGGINSALIKGDTGESGLPGQRVRFKIVT